MTLLELMLVLSMLAFFIGAGEIGIKNILLRNEIKAASQTVLLALNFARSYSIMHRKEVNLCPTEDDLNCSDRWESGILIYLPSNEQKLVCFPLRARRVKVIWKAFPSSEKIGFLPNGMTNLQNGTFSFFIDAEEAPRMKIILNKGGRARVQTENKPSG